MQLAVLGGQVQAAVGGGQAVEYRQAGQLVAGPPLANRLEEAVVTLRAAAKLYPEHPRGREMRKRLIKALRDLGREDEAEAEEKELEALDARAKAPRGAE